MARLAMNRFAALGVLSLVAAGVFFSACSNDSNPAPGEPEAGTGAKPGTGGKGTGGSTGDDGGGTDAKPGTGGRGGSSGSGTGNSSSMPEGGPDSGSGGSGGAGPGDSGTGGTGGAGATCTEDTTTACIECPKNDKEFLNGCTDSKCTKFTATLEKIVNGQRPALP